MLPTIRGLAVALLIPLAGFVVVGCAGPTAAPAPSGTPTTAQIVRVSPTQAKAIVDGRRGVLVDVRSQPEYDRAHAAGAILLPFDRVATDLSPLADVPMDQELILYCT